MTYTPLAQRMRPNKLSQIVGQKHLLANDAPIARMVLGGYLPSIILHGEAGIGKTTLAQVLAKTMGRDFYALSALTLTVKELRELIDKYHDNLLFEPPIIFIDEIHRFNKAQQDALLQAVETGNITLIGATTENPSFSVNNALLSRCQVYRLEPLSEIDITELLNHALKNDEILSKLSIHLTAQKTIYRLCCGDARKALNILELAVQTAKTDGDGVRVIDDNLLAQVAQTLILQYDKEGQMHHDIISAMIKSIRGSDADAALYWLALMLNAGEKPEFIARRLVISASEDIGLANPNALILADSALRSVKSIGMPEARIILGQIAIYLANSPKSNTSYQAINQALEFAKTHQFAVPLHLRNGTTSLMQAEGFGQGYQYPHDYPYHYCSQNYLPKEMQHIRFYQYGDNDAEQASKNYIWWLKYKT